MNVAICADLPSIYVNKEWFKKFEFKIPQDLALFVSFFV
jgi:hypothetical protein